MPPKFEDPFAVDDFDDDAVDIMGEFDAAALEIGETIVNVAAVEVSPAGWARR